MALTDRTATELLKLQTNGEATAAQIADAVLERIRATDPEVKAFLTVDEQSVRDQAAMIDRKRAAGENWVNSRASPLHSKMSFAPKACARLVRAKCWNISSRLMMRMLSHASNTKTRYSSARPTWMNSPWGRAPKIARITKRATRGI